MAPRRKPQIPNVVMPVFDKLDSGSSAPLLATASFATTIWLVGGIYDPAALIVDTDADLEYAAGGWFLYIYAFADQPGQVEIWGAPTAIPATTYRPLEDPVIVHTNIATTIKKYPVAPGLVFVVYRNFATNNTVFEFSASIRGN